MKIPSIRITRWLFVLAAFFFVTASCKKSHPTTPASSTNPKSYSSDRKSKQQTNNDNNNDTDNKSKSRNGVMNFAESISRSTKRYKDPERAKVSKEQWEKALKEIKNLALPKTDYKKVKENNFMQWRMFLDEPTKLELRSEDNITTTLAVERKSSNKNATSAARIGAPRFDGFASWERMLQDWADDVQEYLDKIGTENSAYPLSSFGNAEKNTVKESAENERTTTTTASYADDEKTNGEESIWSSKTKKPISLPVPAAVKDGEPVVPHTDLSDKSKRIWIVTTAALPWMTGTAVNPLLRAAYMTTGRKEAGGSVTLMLPWLERLQDQEQVYGTNKTFDTPKDQEDYIRTWLRDSAKLPEASTDLNIEWYTAWQNKVENSVYSMGDITALIPEEEVDICILEEPEHLNWYRAPGESWTDKFKHVVGIVHTNYFVYAQEQPAAFIRAPAMRLLCSWMCRAHCHRIIKLSGTLDQFAPEKELIENVHGIRGSFLEAGKEVKNRIQSSPKTDPVFGSEAEPSVYFIGKMLWSKGLGSLMELLKYAEESAGIRINVDMYGGGPDKEAADARAKALDVDMKFYGPIDHAELAFTHKIFINPSTSEVLCTTVAEALGMGKFVIVPSHPSNDFFAQFPNCLTYTNKEEFVGDLYYALTHSPEPMAEEYLHALSWQAATERLEAAGSVPIREEELRAEALASDDASIEITLPPLIDDNQSRQIVADGLRKSRERYRQFRTRLSQEVMQSKVLPTRVKQSMISELDKRLDLDIDRILESSKLRLQLSPAELDQQLLDLYKKVGEGPGGDILRIIGGGQEVALQDLYIKRQASRKRFKDPQNSRNVRFGPFEALGEGTEEEKRTASQWVNLVLRNNLPRNEKPVTRQKDKSKMSMSLSFGSVSPMTTYMSGRRLCQSSFTRPSFLGRSSTLSNTLLI